LILFTIGLFLESTLVLNSPAIFFYFIIIILSTLSLEFKISVSIGIVGAVEYVVIAYILTEQFGTAIGSEVYNSLIFHIGKSNLIIVCGVIAGYVAEQIKKKINNVSNSLVERNKVINMFGQQISSSIVEYLIENDNKIISERKYVCVMFLDIRDFSQLAESMQPEEIIKFQNDVFGFMIEIINNHHGIINQFLGDGYMATFGAPLSSGNDSQNAVNAAIEITEELKRRNNNAEFPRTNIGIGLHSGYVVAGNVGTDIRKQYSISGNTVILASRIEQLNKKYNSQILISKEVLDNVNISNEIVSHGKVEIKGREEPIEIFQIN
jgi:adenylate cyclase